MRKTIFTLMLAAVCSVSATAQIADGFYHVKNAVTTRYISISDNDPSNYDASTYSANMNIRGIRSYQDYERVATSPSCVIFIKHVEGNQYDLYGQGTSLHNITNGMLYATLEESGGNYTASGTYKGIKLYIVDSPDAGDEKGLLLSSDPSYGKWKVQSINTDDEWIGIQPDVKTSDGYYWGTVFAGYSFKLVSEGMKAYYVNDFSTTQFNLVEWTDDVVPAGMPVIIRCTSEEAKNNKILPVSGGYTPANDNKLGGVYCALVGVPKHKNTTTYFKTTMRVLGEKDGQLAFVQASEDDLVQKLYLKANKAYLNVAPTCAATMLEVHSGISTIQNDEKAGDNATYSLTGVRLPEGATPRPGIYIKNGQKVVVK